MLEFGHEPPHQRLDRVGAEKHRFGEAARMQQPRGEDVATLRISAELDLIDSEKIDGAVERHRFHCTDKIGRVWRDDFFFAGDQRHRPGAAQFDDAIVILAGEQPQRKPDHPAFMAEHALDREMRLAGIGRPEDRDKARSGAEHGHGKGIGCVGRHGKSKPSNPPRCVAAENPYSGRSSFHRIFSKLRDFGLVAGNRKILWTGLVLMISMGAALGE